MTEDVPGYRVLDKVGEGGFSVVYRAYQERLDREVALKVLSVSAVDDAAMKRFQRECKITGRLSGHPNVVTVLDTGSTRSGRPYIAMEYFERGALTDRIRREGPLPVPEVLRIGVKMAGALAATHETEVLHRDVKPQNILVSRYGEPALADFGIARLVDSFDATHTQAFTPHHAAPEVLEGKQPGVASDIYSLGSTLYQLLTGLPAFKGPAGEGIAQLMLRILHEPPPPIPRDDVPPPLFEVICTAMAKRPEQRFPSAVAFAQRLQRLQAELGLPVTDLAHSSTPADETPSPWAPNGVASWTGGRSLGLPPPPQWTAADPSPLPPRAEPSTAEPPLAERGTTAEGAPGRRGPSQGLLVAGAITLVGGLVGGIVALGALGGDGDAQTPKPTSTTAQNAGEPSRTAAPPIPQSQVRAATPRRVRLVADLRTSVRLRWEVPAISRELPIIVQLAPANGRSVISAGNGATNTVVDGLRRDTGYCFRVGAMLRTASGTDLEPVIAWSRPTCIRGAKARTT